MSSFSLDHKTEDNAAKDEGRIKELDFGDNRSFCHDVYCTLTSCLPPWISLQNLRSNPPANTSIAAYYPCREGSLSSESQTWNSPDHAELPASEKSNLVTAPPSLEISRSAAKPQEIEFGRSLDSVEKKESIAQQADIKEMDENENNQQGASTSTPLSAAPARPELEEADDILQDDDVHVTEYSVLAQKEHKIEDSPSKERLLRRPRGGTGGGKKGLFKKAAVKGGQALRKIFRRGSAVQ